MNFAGRFSLCLTAMLWLPTAVRAEGDQPYAGIATRNVFALVPIPVHKPEDDLPPADPPPKITPNGIMTIFGKLQVLFKVAAKPAPGQPAKDNTYMMCEGDRQDEIEVTKINEKDAIVTFDNHGTVQELPLVVAQNSTVPAPAPAPGPAPGAGPGAPPAAAAFGGRMAQRAEALRNRFNQKNPDPGNPIPGGIVPPGMGGPPVGGPPNGGNTQPPDGLSPEAKLLMLLEAQQANGQNPMAQPNPPPQ